MHKLFKAVRNAADAIRKQLRRFLEGLPKRPKRECKRRGDVKARSLAFIYEFAELFCDAGGVCRCDRDEHT